MQLHSVTLGADLEQVRIVPISDVHPATPFFNEKAFRKLIGWIADTPDAFCVLNGDLFEFATRTSKGDSYTTTMNPGEELRYMRTELTPIREKILCVTIGNHEERIYRQDGIDLAETLAYELGAFYGREGCLLKVSVGRQRYTTTNHKQAPVIYTLYVTHGNGGGKMPGSKMNNMQRLALTVAADVYCVGHGHAEMSFKDRWLVPDIRTEKVEERERAFVQAGSFQQWGGYAERCGYVPGSQEMPVITLNGTNKEVRVSI